MKRSLSDSLVDIRTHMATACAKAGRPVSEVELMAITKQHQWPEIAHAVELGLTLFGENRVQEAMEKYPAGPRAGYSLHMVGHLQQNKIKKAAQFFDAIDSIDNESSILKLDSELSAAGKNMGILIEMNTSGEASKSGSRSPDEVFRLVEAGLACSSIRLEGMMTLGPLDGTEAETRRAFALLRETFEKIRERYAPPHWSVLSMGMSSDFPLAIAEGATRVRIGSALFGGRT